MDAGLEILDEGGEQGGGGRRGEEVPRVDRAPAVAGVADQALGAEQEAEVEEQQALRSQPTCKMVVVVGELDGASVGGVVLGRGSGFGVGEVGLPGGNGELGAAEEERRRAKLGDAVVWRGADAGRVSVNADCSTAKQAHCTRFANRDSFFVGNAFVVGSVLVHPTTDVAEGAFLTQSRVAHSFRSRGWRRCVCRSRGLNTGPRDLSPLEKLCEQKKDNTCNNTTRT